MQVKRYLNKGAQVGIILLVMFLTIGFVGIEQSDELCREVIVNIDNQYENFFIDENDVLNRMTENGNAVIKGTRFADLDLKKIEQSIKEEPFIKQAEVFKDLKGNVLASVVLRRPLARIVQANGPDAYIAMDGTILPISNKYTTRVTLVSGKLVKELMRDNLYNSEEGTKVMDMLHFINNDKFWKAQVAQLDIDKNSDVTIYPQVTKQLVEFGAPENLEGKFKKLKIFYARILPQKGWNSYQKVNLKYENQIIAD